MKSTTRNIISSLFVTLAVTAASSASATDEGAQAAITARPKVMMVWAAVWGRVAMADRGVAPIV